MSILKKRIYYLLQAYTNETATPEEEQELYKWLEETEDTTVLKNYIRQIAQETPTDTYLEEVDWDGMYDQILKKRSDGQTNTRHLSDRQTIWYRGAAAVLLLLIMGTGAYVLYRNGHKLVFPLAIVSQHQAEDIMPREGKAILKAGDVEIEINQKDTSFQLGGNMVHLAAGQIKITKLKAEQYTLTTPKGSTYRVELADGTLVWLNAASTLKYPSVFTGPNRKVKVEGEAFFDVREDPDHPFIIQAAGQTIRVLGTAFNVQVYRDEPQAVTTLVNGRLQVSIPGDTSLLEPGQQTEWNKFGHLVLKRHAEIAQAVAWKDGYFRFYNEDIRAIMRRLARWYDVEVTYGSTLKPQYFGGLIRRDNDLSKVLKMLEATNDVHFKVEGNKVTVMQ